MDYGVNMGLDACSLVSRRLLSLRSPGSKSSAKRKPWLHPGTESCSCWQRKLSSWQRDLLILATRAIHPGTESSAKRKLWQREILDPQGNTFSPNRVIYSDIQLPSEVPRASPGTTVSTS